MRPRPRRLLLIALLVLAPSAPALAPGSGDTVDARLSLPVHVHGTVDVALLEPFDPRSDAEAARAPDAAEHLWTGRLASTGGLVRLVEWDGARVGLVDAPEGLVWVTEEAGTLVALAPERVPDDGAFPDVELAPPAGVTADTGEDTRDGRLQLLLDGEVTYVQRYGAFWREHQLAVITLVDAMYRVNLGVEIEVVEQHAWTEEGPLTGRIECNGAWDGLLDQFRVHWERTRPTLEDPRELAHLFSMRPLAPHPDGGLLIGCGYIGVLESQYAYSASYANPLTRLPYDARLVAHEIGHNFNGLHRRAIPTPGSSMDGGCTGTPTIMFPFLCESTLPVFSGMQDTPTFAVEDGNAPWMRAHAEARI